MFDVHYNLPMNVYDVTTMTDINEVASKGIKVHVDIFKTFVGLRENISTKLCAVLTASSDREHRECHKENGLC